MFRNCFLAACSIVQLGLVGCGKNQDVVSPQLLSPLAAAHAGQDSSSAAMSATNTEEPAVAAANQYETVEQLRVAAEKGDVAAQALLGQLYVTGQGVPRDVRQGHRLTLKAAEQGNALAQFNLGQMYRQDLGKQDLFGAIEWLIKSANQGFPQAQQALARIYDSGNGAPRNYYEARLWYQMLALHGDVQAQARLGEMYFRGVGVERDMETAQHWLRLAANQGDSKSRALLKQVAP